jgi:hypothetical protein
MTLTRLKKSPAHTLSPPLPLLRQFESTPSPATLLTKSTSRSAASLVLLCICASIATFGTTVFAADVGPVSITIPQEFEGPVTGGKDGGMTAAWTGTLNNVATLGLMYCVLIDTTIVSFHTQDTGSAITEAMKSAVAAIEA